MYGVRAAEKRYEFLGRSWYILNAIKPRYIRLQIEKAYPAGVTSVGYRSDIICGVTSLIRPDAAIQLNAMTPRVATSTSAGRIRSDILFSSDIIYGDIRRPMVSSQKRFEFIEFTVCRGKI
jgi:hypothetical protein